MNKRSILLLAVAMIIPALLFCSKKSQKGVELKSFPLNSLEGVIAQDNVAFDPNVSFDGKGSLRIVASDAQTVPLFEIGDIGVDNARLFYRARVRTERVIGQVYLEMLCHFPDKGEFFSRGQATLLAGTNDWTFQETQFVLQKGETPDLIKLNLVINGRGTAWIDDIRLAKAPLGN